MSKATIKLDDKIDNEDSLGTLIVVLLKARNLNDKHKFRKQDVFAQASLNGAEKKTNVDIKGGQHPEWDSEVRFVVMKNAAAKYRKLEVSCYAREPRSEDLLGKGVIDISETLRTGEFDDWVPLDVDGVARGDLYLEMTYYANAPPPVSTAAAPNKLLAAVQNQQNGLTRRPSKLPPADRLSRPPVGRPQAQPQTQQQSHGRPHSRLQNQIPPSHSSHLHEHYTPQSPMYPNSVSPPRRYDPLPENDVPNPYLSSGPRPGPSGQIQGQEQGDLPSLLRPGSGRPSTTTPTLRTQGLGHARHSSDGAVRSNSYDPNDPNRYGASSPHVTRPPSPPNPYIGGGRPTPASNPYLGNSGLSPNPYLAGGGSTLASTPAPGPPRVYSPAPHPINTTVSPAQSPYTAYGHPQQPPASAPLLWRPDNMNPAQPPSNGSFAFPIAPMESFNKYNMRPVPSPALPNVNMGYHQQPSPPRDERDLQSRYQTPLPLPPGAERPAPKSAPAPAPAPIPAPAPAPAPVPEYTRAPTPKNNTPLLDSARVETLRRAEEEATRRREQELKDLELAMQLDRELNIAEERRAAASKAGMPGGW